MKRQFGPQIPGENLINLRMLRELLHSVLDTLSEREATVIAMRFGLADGLPKTLDEVGKVYGVSRERIQQIENKVMSLLRHKSRTTVLRDYLDNEHYPTDWDELSSLSLAERGLIHCEKHGWCEMPSSRWTTCEYCPCPVFIEGGTGRPQRYCSDACKQVAYRRRRARAAESRAKSRSQGRPR